MARRKRPSRKTREADLRIHVPALNAAECLAAGLDQLGLTPPAVAKGLPDRLLRYLSMVGKWNPAAGLVAPASPTEWVVRHLLDSLALLPAVQTQAALPPATPTQAPLPPAAQTQADLPSAARTQADLPPAARTQAALPPAARTQAGLPPAAPTQVTLLDVGSGAGLPGLPLAITRPDMPVRLLDRRHKACAFMRQVAVEMGLDNVEVICEQIENYHPPQRPALILARAVAPVGRLLPLLEPLLAAGGRALIPAGPPPTPAVPAGWQCEYLSLQVPFAEAPRGLLCLCRP